jgi:hypothetical protein
MYCSEQIFPLLGHVRNAILLVPVFGKLINLHKNSQRNVDKISRELWYWLLKNTNSFYFFLTCKPMAWLDFTEPPSLSLLAAKGYFFSQGLPGFALAGVAYRCASD